ncbi:MAG TPA: MFS transporter [Candidatus Omnitrophica bacterium]|nr:MFS transporter [Candidatus Omnitrophota bacterium]
MARFAEVLKNKNFFLLWLGQIISQFGDKLTQMALIALVYQRAPGSALQLAKVISFTIIPVFIIGPLAGVYVDRWDRRKTMYICDVLRCLFVLLIPLSMFFYKDLILSIYIIVFLIFCIGRFFVPAKMSIIPDLVEEKDLLLANSLFTNTGMIAAVLGLGLSGILVFWVGAKGGFYLDSLTFLISGICIFLISKKIGSFKKESIVTVSKEVLEVIQKSVAGEMKEGILYLVRHKELRFVIGILFLLWAALGSIYTVIIVFVQQSLHSVTRDLGILGMFIGAGLFVGSLIYGRFGQKMSLFKTIFLSLSSSGIVLAVFAFVLKVAPSFSSAAVLVFILGVFASPIVIACTTLVHQVSHNEMRGKIFSSLEIINHFAFLVFMFISALIADKVGQDKILIGVGVILIISGILGLIFDDKNRREKRIN